MNTYEGACRFCGEIEIVMADNQTDADEIVTERCHCGGFARYERKRKREEKLRKVAKENPALNFEEIPGECLYNFNDMLEMMDENLIEKAQYTVAGSTLTLQRVGSKIRILRQAKTEMQEEE